MEIRVLPDTEMVEQAVDIAHGVEVDHPLVEELLAGHSLQGRGTVDIDGVEVHSLGVGVVLHMEVWLQAVITKHAGS